MDCLEDQDTLCPSPPLSLESQLSFCTIPVWLQHKSEKSGNFFLPFYRELKNEAPQAAPSLHVAACVCDHEMSKQVSS